QQQDQQQIYASYYYYLEKNTAVMIQELNRASETHDGSVKQRIHEKEDVFGIQLDEIQFEAVQKATESGVLIITGGPGTGKTTTINFILKFFEEAGEEILLAAPTGRAAKRMSELTGFEAKTIHRLLEVNGGSGESGGFERNASNPLEADVIIIDEVSMVDISLMHALLSAIIPGSRLILVGDSNQLPSVGPGRVLQDLIESKACAIVELKKIFRQAEQSSIVRNAHKINCGEQILLDNKNQDFFFLKRYDADIILNVVLQLIMEKLPKYVEAKQHEIQVLTPMRKGLLGVDRCNKILQMYLNPKSDKKTEIEYGDVIFREGDKVMQIKNNYQIEWEVLNRYQIPLERGIGIFNGDIGFIQKIDQRLEQMTILFDENKTVAYSFKQLEELELAYAITIHKAQGSEYPAIVIPLLPGPRMLLNRNLLYTAVTRAKKCVTLVGDENVFFEMIENTTEQTRYSGLKERIQEVQRI
nr:Flp pilus assembly complex ATPase component TadA [Lachnospiraceae bacterium]